MKLKTAILSLLLGATHIMQAQTMPEVEQQINFYLEGISYWRFQYSPEDTVFDHEVNKEDSVAGINEALYNYIEKVLPNVPGILKRTPKLPENSDMDIVVSPDKKLSIYNWDTHIVPGKQLHNAVGLYDAGSGRVAAISLGHVLLKDTAITPGYRFVEILNLQSSGKTYYLLIWTGNYTETLKNKTVFAYVINNNKLEPAEIFVEGGQKSGNTGYVYDYMSNYDFEKMKEINTIHLSKNGKKLYIPVTEHNQITGKWKVYVFDGTNFFYDEKAK
ncbi:MAG: hypothetical protein KDC07_03340 [Chitinophagaceae bacterium]|nr:hypothetical protein [Chitinophagaceae bacterium]MCB9047513.1 hypothetical protein [Chitinophagales bacterium]